MTARPAERLLDLVVYAPIGAAVQIRDDLPRLVANGRSELENRVRLARWVGEMAVQYGRQRLEQRLAPRPPAPAVRPSTTPAADEAPAVPVHPPHEPFHGYDTLAAAQLVPLLDRLPHAEVHLVRDYEAATRRRRTVLAKIDQILGQ